MRDLIAIILAAGKGSRIGMPKWKVEYQGATFLARIIENLLVADVSEIYCVASADSQPKDAKVKIVINPDPRQGMLSSVYYGISEAPESYGYLLFPVDHPLVASATIVALKEAFFAYPKNLRDYEQSKIVFSPVINNKRGHPILISRALAREIRSRYFAIGLKGFLQDTNAHVEEVRVRDEAILRNINTQQDLVF